MTVKDLEHPCLKCIWGKYEGGGIVYCPFKNCITEKNPAET